MKPSVYLETTVFGYLALRSSSALRIAANHQTTHEWWATRRDQYELFISRFVIDECSDGDPQAAAERSVYLQGIQVLSINADVEALAEEVAKALQIPKKASIDALHISIAAVNGVEYLLTWNCRHIANPALRPKIESVCRNFGFEPPIICTPLEMLEIDDVE